MIKRTFVGSTIQSVKGMDIGSDEITVITDGGALRLYHDQDCCESVSVEDVTGDPADLIGKIVVSFEEATADAPSTDGSGTWTFYKIRTTGGDVTIRWLGESSGYYSESVEYVWTPVESPAVAVEQTIDWTAVDV